MTKQETQEDIDEKDSWLVYFSRDLGKLMKRGKGEVDILVDSSKCAYQTTKKVTKKILDFEKDIKPKILGSHKDETHSSRSLFEWTDDKLKSVAKHTGRVLRVAHTGIKAGISGAKNMFIEKEDESKQLNELIADALRVQDTGPKYHAGAGKEADENLPEDEEGKI